MNNIKVRRIVAYLIDIFIISIILTLLGKIDYINPYKEQYEKTITSYNEYYNDVMASLENSTTKPNLITKEYKKYMYDMQKYGISISLSEIIVVIAYFTLFPLFNRNQTIGKRLLKIVVVNDDESSKVGFIKFLLRSLIIPMAASIFLYCNISTILNVISVLIFNKEKYIYANLVITLVSCVICYVDVIMMLASKESKSLHDRILKTKVIDYVAANN